MIAIKRQAVGNTQLKHTKRYWKTGSVGNKVLPRSHIRGNQRNEQEYVQDHSRVEHTKTRLSRGASTEAHHKTEASRITQQGEQPKKCNATRVPGYGLSAARAHSPHHSGVLRHQNGVLARYIVQTRVHSCLLLAQQSKLRRKCGSTRHVVHLVAAALRGAAWALRTRGAPRTTVQPPRPHRASRCGRHRERGLFNRATCTVLRHRVSTVDRAN